MGSLMVGVTAVMAGSGNASALDGPTLISLATSPSVVLAGSSVTITYQLSSLQGVAYTTALIQTPGDLGDVAGCGGLPLTPISGTNQSGTYQEVCTIPSSAQPGTYTPTVAATDNAGSGSNTAGSTFEVAGVSGSTTPPTLVSFSALPSPAIAGSTVTMTYRLVSHAPVGHTTVYVDLPNGLGMLPGCSYTLQRTSGTSTDGTYTDVCPIPGTVNPGDYTPDVVATDTAGGDLSSYQTPVVVTGGVPAVPGPPTGLTALVSESSVTLSWGAPASGAQSYDIFRQAASDGGSMVPLATTASTGFVDTAVIRGDTYFYLVEAVNSVGASASSSEASATIPPVQTTTTTSPTTTPTTSPPTTLPSTSPPTTTVPGRKKTAACGDPANQHLGSAVGLSATAVDKCAGYRIVDTAGKVAAFGIATLYGDLSGTHLNAPIVSITATPDGGGYWLLAADGGVFAFGDASFYGSTGGTHLNAPVVGLAVDPVGRGYWLFAKDGGVFSFSAPGQALPFYGSTGGMRLNQPVDGIAVASDGSGYTLVATDGGVFNFHTPFVGSLGGTPLSKPIIGVAASPTGVGYTLVGSDGGVFNFGTPFYGSLGANPPASPIVALSMAPAGNGYYLLGATGRVYVFGPGAIYLGGAQ